MRAVDIIYKKRMGEELSKEEIFFFIQNFTRGEIPDYQASALCMAICFQGMTERENADLTEAMLLSGETIDLSRFGALSVDKHSTGGVGDKTTLIIAPILASLGVKMAKMSGRGLGHTGGTVDKLEAIPGYRTELSRQDFFRQVEKVGVSVIGQSGNLVPADKKLYALRDVTATIDSIPLIASSIMSKKLAAGAENIVLDVKVGSGAFMKTLPEAEELARRMIAIGKAKGRKVRCILSDMDTPLGFAVGNSLEVAEAAEILQGGGCTELKRLCLVLCASLLSLAQGIPQEEAMRAAEKTIENGSAFEKMKEWVRAQGGDEMCLVHPETLPKAKYTVEILSPKSGYLTHMDSEKIGLCASLIGAGRAKKEDKIDLAAGVLLKKKTGDKVEQGEVLCVFHTSSYEKIEEAKKIFLSALSFSEKASEKKDLILKIL